MKRDKPSLQSKKSLTPAHLASLTNIEHIATGYLQAGQQLLLAIEEILKTEFQFTPSQLTHFEQKVTAMMESLAYLEERGLSVQTTDFMERVAKLSTAIAQIRKSRLDADTHQIALPNRDLLKSLGGT